MSIGPQTRAVVVLLAAVIIGAAAGTTIERVRNDSEQERSFERRRPPRPGERRMPSVFEDLDLTDTQREQIRSVFEQYEPRTRAIMQELFPRLRAVQDSARGDIDAILTDEQRAQLAEFGNFWDRRGEGPGRRGFRGRRGGFPGGQPGPPPDSGQR